MAVEKFHFIGIGGIGMSGLARIAQEQGCSVTGSDLKLDGHNKEHVPADAIVVFSTAVKPDNPELVIARERGQPIWHRSELLAHFMQNKRVLAVTGTHGKTTTSAMLAWALSELGENPSYAIGGMMQGQNGAWGASDWFVCEADESDGSFLNYHPHIGVITNCEEEHLDHYGSVEKLEGAYRRFARQCQQVITCAECERLQALGIEGSTYSTLKLNLPVPGWHNRQNGSAVVAVLCELGFAREKILEALERFPGVDRRCQQLSKPGASIQVIDDYAHHPTEIRATLEALKGEGELVAVFQPHRYSRTRDCLGLFTGVFDSADRVIVTDIFAAGEAPIEGVSHESVMAELPDSHYVPREELTRYLCNMLPPGCTVVTLGAGDITRVAHELEVAQ